MNFEDLGLGEKTIKAVNEYGIFKPSTVQKDVIPAILQGKDVFTIAPHACGKTMSYVLPIIEIISKKQAQSILIITSDSKKSVVISDNLAMFNRFHEETQDDDDNSQEADVIIGSPDLLLELASEGRISLENVNILVVDDINLIKRNKQIANLEKVLEMLPTDKQNIVYTNRRSKETQEILDQILKSPQEIKIDKQKEEEVIKVANENNANDAQEKQAATNKQQRHEKRNFNKNEQNDREAMMLLKKHNAFNGRAPKFLLKRYNLAEE